MSATSPNLDPRRAAFRADLADRKLEGLVRAQRFVSEELAQVTAPLCPFHAAPNAESEMVATKILGEELKVFERREGWVWAQSTFDGYVGYAPAAAVGAARRMAPTHRVNALRAHLYAAADLKSPMRGWAPLNAVVTATSEVENGFRRIEGGGWIHDRHLGALGRPPCWAADWISVAEAYAHVPYLWGGGSVEGVDCSGLVQLALAAFGVAAPRDSDMQGAELGAALDAGARLQRGDLIFWPGHVGVMLDTATLLHANAWAMSTVREPLAQAEARIATSETGRITGRRRLSFSDRQR